MKKCKSKIIKCRITEPGIYPIIDITDKVCLEDYENFLKYSKISLELHYVKLLEAKFRNIEDFKFKHDVIKKIILSDNLEDLRLWIREYLLKENPERKI